MLYKNDEPYKLSPNDIKGIEDFFHNKFPLRVIYPPERIQKPKNAHNKRPDKPNSISFDLRAVVRTNTGTEVWRYAENVTVDERGIKRFTPKKFIFNGIRMLDRKEIELIFFLKKKSPYCLGGDNQGSMVKFMFEDLVTEAEKKVARKKIQSKIDVLLYNEDLGLKEDRLRSIAKAYFIKGVDGMSLAQVKMSLDQVINATKDGPGKFFEMVNADGEIKARSTITQAIDKGVIVLSTSGKTKLWTWKTKEGSETICRVPPDKKPDEALYEYYLGNKSFQEDVNAVLLSGNKDAGNKGSNGNEGGNTED